MEDVERQTRFCRPDCVYTRAGRMSSGLTRRVVNQCFFALANPDYIADISPGKRRKRKAGRPGTKKVINKGEANEIL